LAKAFPIWCRLPYQFETILRIQTYHERMWQLTMVSVPKQESSGSHRCRTEARAHQLKAPSASACPRQYFGNQKTPTILCFLPVDLSYFQAAEARSASRLPRLEQSRASLMDVPNNASFTLEPRLALSKMVTSSSFPSQGWIFELGGRPRATAGPLPQRGSWPPASSQLRRGGEPAFAPRASEALEGRRGRTVDAGREGEGMVWVYYL
jgi:hypothetical protein